MKLSGSANVTVEKITESEAVLRVDYQISAENCSVKSVKVKLLRDGKKVR